MRRFVIAAIGAGSMVAAWLVFDSAFSDWGFLGNLLGDAAVVLVPGIVIAGGVLAGALDRRPAGYAAVVGGALATVLAFAAWNALLGPATEILTLTAIGMGLAISMLTVGFVPTALVGSLVDRVGHTHS
jgi:hypothetical protein